MAKVQIERVFIVSFDEVEYDIMMDGLRKVDDEKGAEGHATHAGKLLYDILDGVSTAEGH